MLRFEANRIVRPPGRDLALEGLRGFAALAVLYAHLTAPMTKLDPVYAPSPRWWNFEIGTGAVLLFFVLSGYVIGLTNQRAADGATVREFWRRRFWRIFPINALAVVLAWVALPLTPATTLLGNLLFLQNSQPLFGFHVPLLEANPNLWSLHYEAVYYLLFPLVWQARPRVAVLFTALLIVAALRLGAPGLAFFSNLAAGGCFWLAGLWLAWCCGPAKDPGVNWAWPSALLLFFITCRLHLGEAFANWTGLAFPWSPQVNLWHLDLLPAAALLVATVGGCALRSPRAWGALVIAIPASRLAWQMWSQRGWPSGGSRLYACVWLLSLALLGWRPDRRAWTWLAPVGACSYALYAMAAPLQLCVHDQDWLPAGSPWTYWLRLVLVVGLAGTFAWLVETKLQPVIVARFRRRPAA